MKRLAHVAFGCDHVHGLVVAAFAVFTALNIWQRASWSEVEDGVLWRNHDGDVVAANRARHRGGERRRARWRYRAGDRRQSRPWTTS
jgi:hypothetical protein